MKTLNQLFGESPFGHMVAHVHKIRDCVNLIRPIADAIVVCDITRLQQLQEVMSRTEYDADVVKDEIRQKLPRQMFLPVDRDDAFNFVRQLDRMADDCEDFSVVATFRPLSLPPPLQSGFLGLVDKVIDAANTLLNVADEVSSLQMETFTGTEAAKVLSVIEQVCRKEWESDILSRDLARTYYTIEGLDPITIILMEKLCHALTSIADHAENVGKNLRLMIARR